MLPYLHRILVLGALLASLPILGGCSYDQGGARDEYITDARIQRQDGDVDAALDLLREAIAEYPNSEALRFELAAALLAASPLSVFDLADAAEHVILEPTRDIGVPEDQSCAVPNQGVRAIEVFDPVGFPSFANIEASAVVLDRSGSFATLVGATSTLADGVVTDLTDNASGGQDLTLGDIADFYDRAATWTLRYSSEGTKTVTVNARSDNMVDKTTSVNVVVDGTQPGAVGALTSPAHAPNVWSNDPTISYTWNAAFDARSGISGYGIFETSSATIPGATQDIGAVTSYTSAAWPSSNTPRYFNIRSVDRSGNWDADFRSTGPYLIDVTAPSLPTLASSSHPVGIARCENTVSVTWTAASDAHSGVAGYGHVWSTSPAGAPANIVDTTGTSETTTLGPGTWYLNVKVLDVAGNWTSGFASFGPFVVTADCGTPYCGSVPNSTGLGGRIRSFGTDRAAANNLTIEAFQLPANTFGLLATSPTSDFTANPGGSQGNLCLGGAIGRYVAPGQIVSSGADGRFSLELDLDQTPTPSSFISIVAGNRYFQAWHRDVNPGQTSNFTEGLAVRFY